MDRGFLVGRLATGAAVLRSWLDLQSPLDCPYEVLARKSERWHAYRLAA